MRLINKLFQANLRKAAPTVKREVVLQQMIDHYSRFSPSPLSLRQFLDFGKFICISNRLLIVHILNLLHFLMLYIQFTSNMLHIQISYLT